MKPFILLLSCLAVLLFTSCGQLSSFQTAQTIEKGSFALGGAVLGYGVTVGDSGSGGSITPTLLPQVEVMGRYGIGERLSMGLKLSTGGNALVDGKYQFLGTRETQFAAAIGGGFEFQGSNINDNVVTRFHLPVYGSWHFTDKTALYLTPRFVYQYVSQDDDSYFLGGSLGLRQGISDKLDGFLEGSLYTPTTIGNNGSGELVYLVGIALRWKLD